MAYKNALPDRKLFSSNTVPIKGFNEIIGKEFRKIFSQRSCYWFQETDLCIFFFSFNMYIRFIIWFLFSFYSHTYKAHFAFDYFVVIWISWLVCFVWFYFWSRIDCVLKHVINERKKKYYDYESAELSYEAEEFEQSNIESHGYEFFKLFWQLSPSAIQYSL